MKLNIGSFLKNLGNSLGHDLVSKAQSLVVEAAMLPGTGNEKRDYVVNGLKDQVQGTIQDHLLGLLTETAYAAFVQTKASAS